MRRATITSNQEGTNVESSQLAGDAGGVVDLDLRGVRCPLSWAKAKVWLEAVAPGECLRVHVDEEKGARDIPRAAEAEGFAVLDIAIQPHEWVILIEK